MAKYGLLKYCTKNLGDEIQSLAAARFLPRIDYFIDRDTLDNPPSGGRVKTIFNGWFKHQPEIWPPPACVEPLFVSFHVTNLNGTPDSFCDRESLAYFKRHQPIGCRDLHTLELFTSVDIEAYFSGCLTLTMHNERGSRSNHIYLVDAFGSTADDYFPVPGDKEFRGDLWNRLPKVISDNAAYLSHWSRETDPQVRFEKARFLVDCYATAKLVITRRIHCALPCVALGTPVLFINSPGAYTRMGGLLELVNHCSEEAFEQGTFGTDWELPTSNPVDIADVAQKLTDTCESFLYG